MAQRDKKYVELADLEDSTVTRESSQRFDRDDQDLPIEEVF
jgi:hypothetical protein